MSATTSALIIKPDDFYDDANRSIFGHFLDLQNLSRQIDMTLLVERLRTAGEYERIGGAAYLADVARSVPTAANAVHYAEIVRDKATAPRSDQLEHRDSPRCLR